jgi:hypothetical protein
MGGRAQRTKTRNRDLEDGEIAAEVMTEKVTDWVASLIRTQEPPAGPDRDRFHQQLDRLLHQVDFIAAIMRGEKS